MVNSSYTPLSSIDRLQAGSKAVVEATIVRIQEAVSVQGNSYKNIIVTDGRVSRLFRMANLSQQPLAVGARHPFAINVVQNPYDTGFFIQEIGQRVGSDDYKTSLFPQDCYGQSYIVSELLTITRVVQAQSSKRVAMTREGSELQFYISLWPDNLLPGLWDRLSEYEYVRVRINHCAATRRQGSNSVSLKLIRNLSEIELLQ